MNRLAPILACLALLVTALVPSGYMAARADDGSIAIMICNGQAGAPVSIGRDNPHYDLYALIDRQRSGHDQDEAEDEPCDMGTSPLANAWPSYFDNVDRVRALPAQNGPATLTGIFPSGLPPSTGPPIS